MDSVKTGIIKTKEHIHPSNQTSIENHHGHQTKLLKHETKIIKSDYQMLSIYSERWLDSVQEMQTKWEVLSNTITSFGNGLYVNSGRMNELSSGFHRLQNLMFPIIKTTKIGVHDNAENISHHRVGKLKKKNQDVEHKRVRADHAAHKLEKYRSKDKTNPSTLKKKESNAEKASMVYDESYLKYKHGVKDLESMSVESLHFSRQLLFDIQDFFNTGFASIHYLKQGLENKPVQEKLYSRFALIDQALPPTYEKYESSFVKKDHNIPIPHGSIIYDDKEDKKESKSEEIKETTTEITTTTTTYEIPANLNRASGSRRNSSEMMYSNFENDDNITTFRSENESDFNNMGQSTSNSFKRLSVSECSSPMIQSLSTSTYISSDAGDLSTTTNSTFENSPIKGYQSKKVLIPTVIKEQESSVVTTSKPDVISSTPSVHEYVYQGESSEVPTNSQFN